MAESGQEAIDFIDGQKFDLVISDLKMPGLSGLDVVRHIKKHSRDTEVIIVTGVDKEERPTMLVVSVHIMYCPSIRPSVSMLTLNNGSLTTALLIVTLALVVLDMKSMVLVIGVCGS